MTCFKGPFWGLFCITNDLLMQVWKYASVPLLRQISVPGGAVFIYFVNRVLIFNNESFAVLSDNFGMRMHRRFLIVKRIPGYGFLFVHLISYSFFCSNTIYDWEGFSVRHICTVGIFQMK